MWFRNNYCLRHHSPRCAIFSVPNERNDRKEAMTMKATGMMSGVSDLIVVRPGEVIFVEVKTESGVQSPKQREFESIVTGCGFRYELVRSLDEFKTIMR